MHSFKLMEFSKNKSILFQMPSSRDEPTTFQRPRQFESLREKCQFRWPRSVVSLKFSMVFLRCDKIQHTLVSDTK